METLIELKKSVENYFFTDLTVKNRKVDQVKIRYLYYHLAYRMFPVYSFEKIGKSLNQDHATVIYALKELPNILAFDKRFARQVEKFTNLIDLKPLESDFNVPDFYTLSQWKKSFIQKSAIKKIKELEKKIKELESSFVN